MEILRDLDNIRDIGRTSVALGNFDGVHLGHQELIKEAVRQAHEDGAIPAVFTFSNHPSNVIPGCKAVKSILTEERKIELIEDLGVEYLFDVPFTEDLMNLEAEDFVKEILVERLNVKDAFCGFNYQFGARAFGTPEILEIYGNKYGFSVFEMPPFEISGKVVSSSLIRLLIEKGYVNRCKEFMGRNYEVCGEVVVGNRLGKSLGFPTSNLNIDETMVTPPNGVYTTFCDYKGVKYPSITNVGVKPTIGNFEKNIETHIFNFDKELYGKVITVEFLKRMREEEKFESLEALSQQIVKDCEKAKSWFEKQGDLK